MLTAEHLPPGYKIRKEFRAWVLHLKKNEDKVGVCSLRVAPRSGSLAPASGTRLCPHRAS